MITTRQIKSRFRKSHLLKLANELLAQDLELKSGTKKWFELRFGHKVEELCELVSFKEILPGKDETDKYGRRWHTFFIVLVTKQKNYRGNLIDITRKFEIGCEDIWLQDARDKFFRPGWVDRIKKLPFEQQLDHVIMWDLMRSCSHVIKDNSAIPIYI